MIIGVQPMSKKKLDEKDFHKKTAVNCFNHVWDLLGKKKRTKEEDDDMVHSAHASRYHWGKIGTPLHFLRGEWQISRVYSVLKRAQPAIYHAKRSLQLCKANKIKGFDLAFAYEALARAYMVAGKKRDCVKNLTQAKKVGGKIEKAEDKRWFMDNLKTISCK